MKNENFPGTTNMNFKEFLANEIAIDNSQWQQTRNFVLKILDEFADGKQKFETIIKLLDSLQHPALMAPVARLKSIYKNMSKTNIIPSMNSFYRVIDDIKNGLQEMPSQIIGHKMFKKPRHSPLPI